MPTEYTSFPIQGRKTNEFTVATTVAAASEMIFWNGVPTDNLKRITAPNFMNSIMKALSSTPITLSADKTIIASDTFAQILVSGASPRTVSVTDGLSCFVSNSSTSTNILTVEGTVLAAGESCFVFWDGTSAHNVIKMASSGGSPFLAVTLTDIADATYYYYGGLLPSTAWQVNRYLKSDPTVGTSANLANNGAVTTLASAWTNRTTLTYA